MYLNHKIQNSNFSNYVPCTGWAQNGPPKLSRLTQYHKQFLTEQHKILNCYSFAVKPHLSCNFISTKSTVIKS